MRPSCLLPLKTIPPACSPGDVGTASLKLAFLSSTLNRNSPGALLCFPLLDKRHTDRARAEGNEALRFDKQAGDSRSNQGKRTYMIPQIHNAALTSWSACDWIFPSSRVSCSPGLASSGKDAVMPTQLARASLGTCEGDVWGLLGAR